MFELRETGDWDIFLGPRERARAETGGADQWVSKRRELPGFAIVNEIKCPHPWDTHYQFSIKTLLSKQHTHSIANPTWGDIFECCLKAQSSKLEHLFCHVSVKRDFRALSFELGKGFRKCHPKWG